MNIVFGILFFLGLLSTNTSTTTAQKNLKLIVEAPSHKPFTTLLKKHVNSTGKVNYKKFKQDKAALNSYLSILAKEIPAKNWSKNDALAYWINAYNAYTIQLIIDNYPTTSITKLHSGKPWDKAFINLAGKAYSLNDIENKIIRPTYNEPRIHFALNCAAVSCPPLLNEAFEATTLEKQLAARTKSFINSSANTFASNSVTISKIFDWYKTDFSNVITFLNKYTKTTIAANATINYAEYNWNLNEQ
jgi:hypothetical protein